MAAFDWSGLPPAAGARRGAALRAAAGQRARRSPVPAAARVGAPRIAWPPFSTGGAAKFETGPATNYPEA